MRCLCTHAQLRVALVIRHSAKIGGRPLWSPSCSQPSARFRNWCRGGRFRRRGRRGHVFFDEIPDRHRDEERDQLRAPVFQRQSGPQDGNQYRAPVLRDLSWSDPRFHRWSIALIFLHKSDMTSRKRRQRTKQPDKVRRGFSFLLWFGLTSEIEGGCAGSSQVHQSIRPRHSANFAFRIP